MNDFPSAQDYSTAVQNPPSAFGPGPLSTAEFDLHPLLQVPVPASGSAAVVFKASVAGSERALRFFLREDVSDRDRYTALNDHVGKRGLADCVATARWCDNAITVHGQRYPMIDMQWINGRTLETYVEYLVDIGNTAALATLAQRWRALIARLQEADFAHGDLQHGNVLIDEGGTLRLVDLDGCWIKPFQGKSPPSEAGHPNYQRPGRVWGPTMDTFPGLVIYTALLALSKKPALWSMLHDGEDTLFKAPDFTRPGSTEVWRELGAVQDPQLRTALQQLEHRCKTNEPSDDTLEASLGQAPPSGITPWWIQIQRDHGESEPPSQVKVAITRPLAEVPLPPPPPKDVPVAGRSPGVGRTEPCNPANSGGWLYYSGRSAPVTGQAPHSAPPTPAVQNPAPTLRPRTTGWSPAWIVVVVVAFIVLILVATKAMSSIVSSPSSHATTTVTTPPQVSLPPVLPPALPAPTSSTTPTGLSYAEQQLWTALPMEGVNSGTCQSYAPGEQISGVQAALTCSIIDPAMAGPIEYYQFADDASTQAYLNMRAQPITAGAGDCAQGTQQDGAWQAAGQERGRLVCVFNPKGDGYTYFKIIWANAANRVAVIQDRSTGTAWNWFTQNADQALGS
jgi:eukaryotic-like serine/threonine-protein kinase